MIISRDDQTGNVIFSVCMGGKRCTEKYRNTVPCEKCRQYQVCSWTWIDYIAKKHKLGDWVEL